MDNVSGIRVLGIDPGSRSCGYGIVDGRGNRVSYVTSGTIVSNPRNSLPEKLNDIYIGILRVIDDYNPTVVSVEEMFFAKNAKSAIKLGQSKGIAVLAAAQRGIQVSEYAPTRVKLALTGRGRAGKNELQKMLSYILGIDGFGSTDESDALAIAICHLNLSRYGLFNNSVRNGMTKRRKKRFTINPDDIST